jgi:hypothetical protein
MDNRPRLAVGDKCWLLHGTILYEAVISEVRVVLEGTESEFVMYRVEGAAKYLDGVSQHRSDLFRVDDERSALVDEICSRIESLEYLKREVQQVGDDQ